MRSLVVFSVAHGSIARIGKGVRKGMVEQSRLKKISQSEFDSSPKAFRRAANQRLVAAKFLLANGASLDAVYLAGYVVECALKALILQRTPAARRKDVCRDLTSGARSHNFDVLAPALRAKGCSLPSNISVSIDTLNDEWGTDLRYVGT